MRIVVVVIALLLALHAPAVAAPVVQPPGGDAAAQSPAAARKLDVNRATAAELVSVPGIGESLARAIVELRERKGSFGSLNDLLEVRGIGAKNLARFSEHLTVGRQVAPPAGGAPSQAK